MTWPITGGAGYIGAHVVRAMTGTGERVVVLDDLSTGAAARLEADMPLVKGSALDGDLLGRVFADHEVTGVAHLAAHKQVAESMARPTRYYRENVWPSSSTRSPRPGSDGSPVARPADLRRRLPDAGRHLRP